MHTIFHWILHMSHIMDADIEILQCFMAICSAQPPAPPSLSGSPKSSKMFKSKKEAIP